jgi:nucleotide-binding universal stress UspA family protein
MRVVIWIAEDTWEGCVDRAGALLSEDAAITLLHVAPSDVEALASHGGARLLGRHPPPPPGPPLRAIAEEEARAMLEAAHARLGRAAELLARRGKVEREVLEACVGADLLVLARDGERRLEPKSIGPRTRFVLDHAPCQVLLVWPEAPPGLETIKLPPHLR